MSELNFPVPKDIPLPLPAPEPLLIGVLVVFFLMHIVFVNFMIGGSFLALWYQIKGLKNKAYDRLAYKLASSITVIKSLAVVLGIGPLLAINTLYTMQFYSANALTGAVWISIVPTVAVAFLLTYAHKYWWHCLENIRGLHIAIGALATGIFLWVPLIFLTNVNLMLHPERWTQVQGFMSALTLPNVFPRYFHFLTACLALTGLYIVWVFRDVDQEEVDTIGLPRAELVRTGYRWLFWPTLAQFLFGPVVLLTLPDPGPVGAVMPLIGTGALLGVALLMVVRGELKADDAQIGKRFKTVVLLMLAVLTLMGAGRHAYRVRALEPQRTAIAEKTAAYEEKVRAATPAQATAPEK